MRLRRPRGSKSSSMMSGPELQPLLKDRVSYKLARPFHEPYRVVRIVENGLENTSASAPCNSNWSGFESSPPVS